MRHRTLGTACAAALLCLATAPAWAQPAEIPIQGTLTDSDSVPLTGTHTVVFSLYASQSGGEALFGETHSVTVDQGAFTAYLGSIDSLDLGLFDGTKLFVGIKVGSDDEMTPRLPFGSVPYAAYAKETAAVPAGAVMHFNLEQCPPGWSELTAARGRVVLGLPAEGELLGTVQGALGNLGTRSITQVPRHRHGVGTLAGTAGSAGSQHYHRIEQFTISGGSHSHTISLGHGDGTSYRPHWAGTNITNRNYTATGGSHSHTVPAHDTTTSTGATLAQRGAHSHSVTLSGNTADNTGGVDSVDVTMPYIQLLICEKT